MRQLLTGVYTDIQETSEITPYYLTASLHWAVEITITDAQMDIIEQAWELLPSDEKMFNGDVSYFIHDALKETAIKIYNTRVIDAEKRWKARKRGATEEDKNNEPLVRDMHNATWLFEKKRGFIRDGTKYKVHLVF